MEARNSSTQRTTMSKGSMSDGGDADLSPATLYSQPGVRRECGQVTAGAGTSPSTRRRPPDRRAHILTAAARRFWSEGYHQVSMAHIAADVGIGASALYRHFRGKQELLLTVLDRQLSRMEEL